MKEEEQQKFIKDKELLIGLILGKLDPTIKQQLNSLPEYAQVKNDQDIIGTIKCLCNICYANKDGGMTFKPYSNMKLKKKNVSLIMKVNRTGCDYKEDIKVNYESSLSVACRFLHGTCSLMKLLEEAKLIWNDYLAMSEYQHTEWEKKANDLDMSMFYIQGCNSDNICKDLEHISAFSQDKCPQNIELACDIYCT